MLDVSQLVFDPLSTTTIIVNLCVAAFLSFILKVHFEKYSLTLAGRGELARILPFLTLIVCFIISVVKSSLALSLGLVGALSIVRFRTPIKEPEELVYLFMAIAIGLGLGANQTKMTIVATLFILVIVALFRWKHVQQQPKNLFLTLDWEGESVSAQELTNFVSSESTQCDLKRHDRDESTSHLSFHTSFKDSEHLYETIEKIREKFPVVRTSFIDQSRIPGV